MKSKGVRRQKNLRGKNEGKQKKKQFKTYLRPKENVSSRTHDRVLGLFQAVQFLA